MKKVLIATPALNEQVNAYFAHSLQESIKLGLKNNIDFNCVFLANESILPMARNELINLCYKEKYACMVFIDADQSWNPQCLINIVESDKDVLAVPVVNKHDEQNTFNVHYTKAEYKDGYLLAESVGTGFLKLSYEAVSRVWEASTETLFRGKMLRNVCEYILSPAGFVGEDITLCRKLKKLGYDILVDTEYTSNHHGNKMYVGSFKENINS